MVPLRYFSSFVELAKDPHFSRTAKRLGIPQSTLSYQVAELERDLEVDLLDRATRSPKLTRTGEAVAAQITIMLRTWDRGRQLAESLRLGTAVQVSLGCTPNLALTHLGALLKSVDSPDAPRRIELSEIGDEAMLEAVLDGSLDVGFIRDPAPSEGLASVVFDRDPLEIVVPSSWAVTELADVLVAPIILVSSEHSSGQFARAHQTWSRITPTPFFAREAPTLTTSIGLVAAQAGMALIPRSLAAALPVGARVLVTAPDSSSEVRLVWRSEDRSIGLGTLIKQAFRVNESSFQRD